MTGTLVKVDRRGTEVQVVNHTGVSMGSVLSALPAGQLPEGLYDALVEWHRSTTRPTNWKASRQGGLFDRDRYLAPRTFYEKVQVARMAMKDDVVSNAAEGTEAMAIGGCSISAHNADEEDAWRQIAGDINLDDLARTAWRGLFRDATIVCGIWMGRKTIKVRGKGPGGRERRKSFDNVAVPLGVTFFDAARIVPVGHLQFGMERLCYMADPFEAVMWDTLLRQRAEQNRPAGGEAGPVTDPSDPSTFFTGSDIVSRFVIGRYEPSPFERQQLIEDGVPDVSNLFELDRRVVFRHTLTRQDWERFPELPLESVFELLDLKNALHQMERAHLLGGASYIVLVTKGTDKLPAEQEELDSLNANMHAMATIPVVVGDHRLDIKIIAPDVEVTLNRDRHDTLDARIFARTWGTLVPTGTDQTDPMKLGQVIARFLESRRRMLRRALEARILQLVRDLNPDQFTSRAKIKWTPSIIALAFDKALLAFVTEARASNEMSRETFLGVFDFDQGDEARQLERERIEYDPIFKTAWDPNRQGGAAGEGDDPETPPDAGQRRAQQRSAGRRQGGNRNGGGAAPGTNQGGSQSPDRLPRRGSRGLRRQRVAAAMEALLDELLGDDLLDDLDDDLDDDTDPGGDT